MVEPGLATISRRRLLRMNDVIRAANAISEASGVVGNCNYIEYVADVKKATDALDELGQGIAIK
jgi:hypothetical protein